MPCAGAPRLAASTRPPARRFIRRARRCSGLDDQRLNHASSCNPRSGAAMLVAVRGRACEGCGHGRGSTPATGERFQSVSETQPALWEHALISSSVLYIYMGGRISDRTEYTGQMSVQISDIKFHPTRKVISEFSQTKTSSRGFTVYKMNIN